MQTLQFDKLTNQGSSNKEIPGAKTPLYSKAGAQLLKKTWEDGRV